MSSLKHKASEAPRDSDASRFMVIGGTRIHYTVAGRGPSLLLLHGVLGSLQSWDGWVEALAPHYRIIRIDLPGYGLSEQLPSDDYTPEYGVELIEQVRRQLHLERFSMAGNSLGGFLAWYYAAHYPERVDKLVLIDPIGYPQKLPKLMALLALPMVGELAQRIAPRFVAARNVALVYGHPELVSAEIIARHQRLLAHGKNRGAMVRTFRRLRAYHEDFELCRKVGRVRAPTLLMWGARDRCVPPSLLDVWRRDLPTARVRIYAEAGHVPMEELPEQTARDAHAFLSEDRPVEQEPRVHDSQIVPYAYARGA
ncbi:MAG: alpha/beta hydrolase [Polyangiales bacterium]